MFTRTPVQQQLNMQCIAASLMKLKGPCCAHNADPPLMAVRGTPDFLSNGCVKSCNLASSTAHYDQLLDRAATALCCLQSSSSYQLSTHQQTCTMLAFYEIKHAMSTYLLWDRSPRKTGTRLSCFCCICSSCKLDLQPASGCAQHGTISGF